MTATGEGITATAVLSGRPVRPTPGDGIVGRSRSVVFAAQRPNDAQDSVLAELVALCTEDVGASDGRRLVRRLAALVAGSDDDPPAFCVVALAGEDLVVFVHGTAEVTLQPPGADEVVVSGGDSLAWVDRIITHPVVHLSASVTPAGNDNPSDLCDLRDGIVPGGGFRIGAPADDTTTATAEFESVLLVPVEADPPMQQAEPETEPAAAPATSALPIHEVEDATVGIALPHEPAAVSPVPVPAAVVAPVMVDGTTCRRGHFNDPRVHFCAQCGIGMVQQTLNVVTGERPSLGVLVLDDGATFLLDGDYVVGREPTLDGDVQAGRARPLVVADTTEILSRSHLAVLLTGWDVSVCDRGSANGTTITPPNGADAVALTPYTPLVIAPGTTVALGRQRTFVFESHRRA